jgi:hypothetical protein
MGLSISGSTPAVTPAMQDFYQTAEIFRSLKGKCFLKNNLQEFRGHFITL